MRCEHLRLPGLKVCVTPFWVHIGVIFHVESNVMIARVRKHIWRKLALVLLVRLNNKPLEAVRVLRVGVSGLKFSGCL